MHFPIAPAKQQRLHVSVGLHACIQLLTDMDKNVDMTGKACEPHTLPTFLNAYTQHMTERQPISILVPSLLHYIVNVYGWLT